MSKKRSPRTGNLSSDTLAKKHYEDQRRFHERERRLSATEKLKIMEKLRVGGRMAGQH